MSKFLKVLSLGVSLAALPVLAGGALAGDPDKGAKVFKKCAACHAVGENAKNKVGPQLNEVFGRAAGTLEDYKYSKAMISAGDDGLVWDDATLTTYLEKPRAMIKGTKMAFAGLKKEKDLENVIAYLATFSSSAPAAEEQQGSAEPEPAEGEVQTAEAASAPAPVSATRDGGVFGLGRVATEDEIAAWDIDVRPDGMGLPQGSGTVADGEVLYTDNCAVCHGDFGEGVGRWPVLAGGQDTLTDERPEKTIGSYWPYLSTVYDYVRRAMPYGNARSLSDDDVYAITAYLLYLNDIVEDEDFELSNENFTEIRLPNEENFIADDRAEEPHYADKGDPCMSDCKDSPVEITMHAQILDVTPGSVDDNDAAGMGGVD
ncbi:c-type cytochrome [Labrenzia sp. 011]|uniref:c-type cytochrome n=1 Tax=Labrenzia sp. 011 TaxID=2171494 RepID=UPI000D51C61E|nr:c-type cytochrome [Labrenzia sp. 011]PVB62176.1 MFS transporter [Labrenzia sp. 011]